MSQSASGLMVCGTSSDAGKSTLVAGLCRWLSDRGLRVAPFKAQNMALNSGVTPSGHEIGRAQLAQAWAARAEPEVAMNPVLLKPTSDRTSQVVVMGRPWDVMSAAEYQAAKAELWAVVTAQLDDLRRRFDVVVCEGAGSPAEINLADDITNLRVAAHAGFPALIVGDIDRGGVFASLFGTWALLPEDRRRLVQGFVVNKFRGDPALLTGGPEELERRTGVPTLGVLPWLAGPALDTEDSLGLPALVEGRLAAGGAGLDVAAVRLPHVSNFTDLEALALEPGVSLRWVDRASGLGRPDLLVLPGTKATVADLEWLRATGLAGAITDLSSAGEATTILGICGGYQMMGRAIDDPGVESVRPTRVEGLSLLPVQTAFSPTKVTTSVRGSSLGHPVTGYRIHHGRTALVDGPGQVDGWVQVDSPGQVDGGTEGHSSDGYWAEGCRAGNGRLLGTSVHGLFESDGFRSELLARVAQRAGRRWAPSGVSFQAARQARFDALAAMVSAHLDLDALGRLLPVLGRATSAAGEATRA